MNVAVNGFGRIGKNFVRTLIKRDRITTLVAINDLAPIETMAHLLKYDSVHGKINGSVSIEGQYLVINNHKILYSQETDVSLLPWREQNVDVVIESTGRFTRLEDASKHITSGARKVIISAPSPSDNVQTVTLGVNDAHIDFSATVLSNASCTTNSAAPLIKVMEDLCGIESAYITTVHSYTGDQRLHDTPHKDLRRARAGAMSIIPTTTGAAKAITKIFPDLDGKIGGCGIRVPVPDGSLTDITLVTKETLTLEQVNNAFLKASESVELKGILEYIDEPLVSIDIVGNTHSCIYDSQLTSCIGNMVKVVGWYDNEIGYSNRLVDLLDKLVF